MVQTKDKGFLIVSILAVFSVLIAGLMIIMVFHYRAENVMLRSLLSSIKADPSPAAKEADEVRMMRAVEELKADRVMDFLSWKSLLTDSLRESSARLALSTRGVKDLKTRHELANVLYYSLGLAYTAGTDFSAAKQSFTEALKHNPADAESCYNLGLLYSFTDGKSDLKKSLQYYNRYLAILPSGARSADVRKKIADMTGDSADKR
jgi:tetratricopeptide (TPR) repeat protein